MLTKELIDMSDRADRLFTRLMVPALALLTFSIAVIMIPLISERFRPWNFAAFGAIALFVAARGGRYGFWLAIALSLGTKLVSDFLNFIQQGYDPDYLPFSMPILGLTLYLGFALYAIIGWSILRRTENPLTIAGSALLGATSFFLWTNFVSWLRQDLPYPQNLAGLLEAYWMGIPFWRGTLMGDLTFSGVLFSSYAILVRVPMLYAKTAKVHAETYPRSETR
jgi:hypothetical protein